MKSDDDYTFDPTVSRRGFLRAAAAGTALVAAPWVRRAAAADDNVLYVNTWGGNWEAAARKFLFDPFTKDTGVQIRTVSPISFAKLAAQVRNGTYQFDVTTLGVTDTARANAAQLIEPAQGHLDEHALWTGAIYENGLATHAFANQIAYQKDAFSGGAINNWTDFWNLKQYPGARSLQRYPTRVLAYALLADGVPPEHLFPYDLDRAFRALDRLKPAIRVWWTEGPQSQQLLRDGEVKAIAIWNDYAKTVKDTSKAPIEIVWNQAVIDKGCWVVAKGTPRAKNAWRLVQHIASNPEGLARFNTVDGSGPLNPKAFDYMDAATKQNAPTLPEHLKQAVVLDGVKLLPQLDQIASRFDRWMTL
jgi:putative spermidine/putrescine transport system substrate-binding protein